MIIILETTADAHLCVYHHQPALLSSLQMVVALPCCVLTSREMPLGQVTYHDICPQSTFAIQRL